MVMLECQCEAFSNPWLECGLSVRRAEALESRLVLQGMGVSTCTSRYGSLNLYCKV